MKPIFYKQEIGDTKKSFLNFRNSATIYLV